MSLAAVIESDKTVYCPLLIRKQSHPAFRTAVLERDVAKCKGLGFEPERGREAQDSLTFPQISPLFET